MGIRHCPRCRAEVEDVDGFCLLGHPLRLEAPRDSLTHLRAEVDRAFEQAKVEVAVAVGAAPSASSPAVNAPPAPPSTRVFETIEQASTGPDPLVEFAPAPRMDWGPEKPFFKRR